MENHLKAKVALSKKSDKQHLKTQSINIGRNLKKPAGYYEVKKVLNSRILQVSMTISHQYPELHKYLEEMPWTVPVDKKPEITLQNLRTYYETLNALLKKYIKEHPHNSRS